MIQTEHPAIGVAVLTARACLQELPLNIGPRVIPKVLGACYIPYRDRRGEHVTVIMTLRAGRREFDMIYGATYIQGKPGVMRPTWFDLKICHKGVVTGKFTGELNSDGVVKFWKGEEIN